MTQTEDNQTMTTGCRVVAGEYGRDRRNAAVGLVLLGVLMLFAGARTVRAQESNLALTPYMGWDSYYGSTPLYEEIIMTVADTSVSRGLLAAGYQYVWLDSGWWDGGRNES